MITRGLVFASEFSMDASPATATTLDRSRFKNHGTNTGITYTRLPSGLWVHTTSIDSNNVNLGAPSSISFTSQPFSVCLWIYPNYLIGTRTLFIRSTGVNGWKFYIVSGYVTFTSYSPAATITSSTLITTGRWYFMVAIRNSTSVRLYSNGIDITSVAGSHSDFVAPSTNLFMGGIGSGALFGYYTLGRIYSRALTAAEVYQTYQSERSLFGV